ncbi:MAG TPA: polymer-forming cytoskeletal protein [Chitinophagaceae bacterium]|jgi:cytoskeletal protein CcmA (bactofilin family)|nr:polymer-forming cytoskeletal protein [Chitinophagaceae bacterium]
MFNKNSKTENEKSTMPTGTSLIGTGTTITGDIVSNGDVRIDGVLKGNIRGTAKILIGQDGVVEGDIEGQQADIMGRVEGRISVKELLNLRSNAIIKGDIRAGKLQIEPTVVFNGQCQMGEASVVEMAKDVKHAIAK